MNGHATFATILVATLCTGAFGQERKTLKDDAPPVSSDPRLVVELFAAAPDIVHPIATDFDAKGRLLVVESHTHFRPTKYDGPKFDRVRVLEDTDGDGKADKFTTFFEGTTFTMDLAVHPNGSVYLATRNEILRLRDSDGDGKADEKTRIAFLETSGNYPHNGLSGITFDAKGNLYFGIGENLGVPYKLNAADGSKIEGGGEGGNLFWITADGKQIRRVATGFWNPFGSCRDIYGRLFVVDNDPDTCPPCRLLQVVEGGDYGFQFRYGRSGRHPFQAWNGELAGTLPMVAGTGESPCEVIAYESDGLPSEYLGDLLVPAWADHRVERYVPKIQGAGTASIRKPFIQGGKEFRPSGLSVAPNGSLFITDWVSRSYELHGKGAVWHVRLKEGKPDASKNPGGLSSPDRRTRDAVARKLAETSEGRTTLRNGLASPSLRIQASCLDALIAAGDKDADLLGIAKGSGELPLRALAVRGLAARGTDVSEFLDAKQPAVLRVEAIASSKDAAKLAELFADADPYLRHAAIHRFMEIPTELMRVDWSKLKDPKQRVGLVLAWRATRVIDDPVITSALADADPDVKLIAAKWVADERLEQYRPQVVEAMQKPNLDARTFVALATTLARLDNKPVNEEALASYFRDRLNDRKTATATRLMALRSIPASHAKLGIDYLTSMLNEPDAGMRVEVLRTLTERNDPKAMAAIQGIVRDSKQPPAVRSQALVALAGQANENANLFVELASGTDPALKAEALRGLVQLKLTAEQKAKIETASKGDTQVADLVARVLGKPHHAGRPVVTETDAWLKRLEGPADAEAGRRVFEHSRVATCAKCHRVDGRGSNIGPDLSLIGRTEKKWIVESILQPSSVVAPHYQSWRIDTNDGRVLNGLLVHTNLDESYYVDAKGIRFKLEAKEMAEVSAARESIMPNDLLNGLADQEIRDLVAYLSSRK